MAGNGLHMEGGAGMSIKVKPELSVKNPYRMDRHRYYELKHFCMQYPLWKKRYLSMIDYPSGMPFQIIFSKGGVQKDTVTEHIDERLYYADRIAMIEQAAVETDKGMAGYIIEGVTQGISYDILKMRRGVPCCKDVYYELYRKFFYILSTKRK